MNNDYDETGDAIIFNRQKLKQYKIDNLLKLSVSHDKSSRLKDEAKTKVASVFVLKNKNCCDKLKSLTKGDEQMTYMKSDEFFDNIKCCYNMAYSRTDKLCEFRTVVKDANDLKIIFDAIRKYLPRETIIWSGLIPDRYCDNYILNGSENPYICSESPLGYDFGKKGVAFVQYNENKDNFKNDTVKNKLKYINQQGKLKGSKCNMYAQFAPETVVFFQKLNDKNIYPLETQKELTGCLRVKNIIDNDGKFIFELHGDETSIKKGKDLEVDVVWSRFNFHTHPEKAYIVTGNVKYAWPSSQDFVGFLDLDEHTIFHTLVSLEGIYTISFHPNYHGNPRRINRNKILKMFHISHHDAISPDEYIIKINQIKYKNEPLFVVKYFSWERATEIFPIFYSKNEDACLVTDNVFELYRKQYGDDDYSDSDSSKE